MGEKEDTSATASKQEKVETNDGKKDASFAKSSGNVDKRDVPSSTKEEDSESDNEQGRSFRDIKSKKKGKGRQLEPSLSPTRGESSSSKDEGEKDDIGEDISGTMDASEAIDALRAKVTRRRAVDAAWACTECKRRKLSCDGKRPCWRCLHAGWECISIKRVPAAEPCTPGHYGPGPACLTCRQHRRVCDRSKPCSRCVRLGRANLCKYPQVWRGKVMEEKSGAKKKSSKKGKGETKAAEPAPTPSPVASKSPEPGPALKVPRTQQVMQAVHVLSEGVGQPLTGQQVPQNLWGPYQMTYQVPAYAQVFGYYASPGGRPQPQMTGAVPATRVPEGVAVHPNLSGSNVMHPLIVGAVGSGMMPHMTNPGGMIHVPRQQTLQVAAFPQGAPRPGRPVAQYQPYGSPAMRFNQGPKRPSKD